MQNISFTCFVGILLVLLQICSSSSSSHGHKPESIPNPMDYPGACNRETVSHSAICDVDNLLVKDSKDVLEVSVAQGNF
jgi:hypothetical protein